MKLLMGLLIICTVLAVYWAIKNRCPKGGFHRRKKNLLRNPYEFYLVEQIYCEKCEALLSEYYF